MPNVIRFLESVGRQPAMSAAEYNASVKSLDAGALRHALLARDQAALNELLGGRRKLLFAILAADEDPSSDI